jgi:hypothetical protein
VTKSCANSIILAMLARPVDLNIQTNPEERING